MVTVPLSAQYMDPITAATATTRGWSGMANVLAAEQRGRQAGVARRRTEDAQHGHRLHEQRRAYARAWTLAPQPRRGRPVSLHALAAVGHGMRGTAGAAGIVERCQPRPAGPRVKKRRDRMLWGWIACARSIALMSEV